MKQRVLIVTKFYYRRGGDCIYALNLENLLSEQGHPTAVFAMDFTDNDSSPWQAFWPSQVDFGGGIGAKVAAAKRIFGWGDVAGAFKRLLDDFKPDVVHLNNIHSYLSPVVAQIAHRRGIKVVWTLHDYKLLCPAYACLNNGQGCEKCFTGKLPVLKNRCMKGSLAASALAWLEALKWNRRKLQKNTDVFICPSSFMASKMQQGGFDTDKLVVLPNFLAPNMIDSYSKTTAEASADEEYYCYIGRLSAEKGVATLLEAAAKLPHRHLYVTGDGPLAQELMEKYGQMENITFTGRIDAQAVRKLLCGARLSVMPSECYENNPLGAIESLCCGTPVVGAAIGGIPELTTNGCGLTFESRSASDLARAIEQAWATDFNRKEIQAYALEKFAPLNYYNQLIKLYS